ncbi:murein hydrolase activator EnvC family protein [Myroides sp. LJL119]
MSNKVSNSKKWKTKLLDKYRVVIVNDRTFEDVKTFKLNVLNVWMAITTLIFLLIFSTVLLLVLTPIKEYIPGYSSSDLKQQSIELTLKVDSLEAESKRNVAYINAIKRVLQGDIPITENSIDSLQISAKATEQLKDYKPSQKETELREMVKMEDKYNLFPEANLKVSEILFSPVDGEVVRNFDPSSAYFGVDFALAGTSPVKSIAKGTVLFTDWSIKDGYIVVVLHREGIVSVYKHLTSLIKNEYDTVQSGEVLGLFDTSDQQTALSPTTILPNFYFELWKDGFPLDPSLFIDLD